MSTAVRRRGSPARATRREELLDAAEAVIRAAGPEASMRAIAAGAGITKPILYRYFTDKGGLYRALAERYTDPLIAQIQAALGTADPIQRVVGTIDVYLRFVETHPQIYRFLVHRASTEPQAHSAMAAVVRRIGSEVAMAMTTQRNLDDRAALTAEALGHAIVGMVHGAGDWWVGDGGLTRAELTAHLSNLLRGGLENLDL